MSAPDRDRDTLALLREVVAVLDTAEVASAMIGAGALALHGYVRATGDLDVAVTANLSTLRAAAKTLLAAGCNVEFAEPDVDDHLGGVLTVTRGASKPVQVVNFVNEKRARNHNPGGESIRSRVVGATGIAVVDLPHLVALKVWAGGPKSAHDVLSLLEVNPDADLAAIDDVCARFGLTEAWLKLRPTTAPTGP